MKKIILLKCIFMFTVNVFALNIGTTNIVFAYEDTSLTLEQQAVVSNCVHKLIEPALPFSSFFYHRDKAYLRFNIYGYPFNLTMFKSFVVENNTMTLPITKSFSTEILSREYLQTKYADAISKLPEFCSRLKSLNVQNMTAEEVNAFFLIPEKERKILNNQHCINWLRGLNRCTFYEVPSVSFSEENVGPNNGLYLWVNLPRSFRNMVFNHIQLIYFNNKWYISSLIYDFSNN